MHFFPNNLLHLIYPRHVSNKLLFINRRSSLQAAYSISPYILRGTIRIIRILSATRLFLRCMVKYYKLLVQNSSWWWIITCLKHVEEQLREKIITKIVHIVGLSHV